MKTYLVLFAGWLAWCALAVLIGYHLEYVKGAIVAVVWLLFSLSLLNQYEALYNLYPYPGICVFEVGTDLLMFRFNYQTGF